MNDMFRTAVEKTRKFFIEGLTKDQQEVLLNYADSLTVQTEDGIQGQMDFIRLLEQKKKELLKNPN
jgi:hypothetical protein